ncbi:cuticular protein glycine-rich 21 precursor [Danaus plexippus plexippus]|uniref:Cuticular protein glycine-rich 21 n=1 Tax=Danaus plexippus plexippus TaxID=278856 RepID=A0A212EXU3_DANPL|nr:cuticular protein glycine-rich 21 precursor [Danaus plexippus plexippus]
MLVISMWALVQCSPFDDGKYKHKTYDFYDDGKYYRPLTEGKYVPTDEGKYTYIYQRGVYPYDGTYKHLERGDSNDYIGYQIYAPRFPFVQNVIKSILRKYISPDIIVIGEGLEEESPDSLSHVKAEDEIAMKCRVIDSDAKNETEVVKPFPPHLNIKEGEKLGTIYNFKGSKVLSPAKDPLTKKVKLEYEVFVRIVEDFTE